MIELIKELSFRNPYYLLLWALIPLIYFILKKYYTKKIDTINLPESSSLLKFKKNWRVTLLPYLFIFHLLAFLLFILANLNMKRLKRKQLIFSIMLEILFLD